MPASSKTHPEDFPFLIFDFDGTIADSNDVYDDFYRNMFSRYGIPEDPDYSEEQKTMTHGVFCRSISDRIHGALTEEQVARQLEDYLIDYYSNRVPFMPGAREYLTRIDSLGTPKSIVTATPRHLILMALEHLGLTDCFIDVVSPEMVGGRDKSFPDIYEKAMALMGHSVPTDFCVYDDAVAAIHTAKALGMFTVGLADPIAKGQKEAMEKSCDLFIHDFRELL